MVLQPLDLCFYKGHSPVPLGVRLLTSIRYGIPFKDCLSHVDIRYNDKLNISAESSGTKLVPFEKSLRRNDIWVYRLKGLPSDTFAKFYDSTFKLLGRPYSYARYLLDAARIFSFVFALTGLILSLFTWQFKVGIFIAIGILQILSVCLQKADAQAYDCSEVVAVILADLKLMPTLPKARNEFPNSIKTKVDMFCWYGMADLIGEWDHKRQEWVNEF